MKIPFSTDSKLRIYFTTCIFYFFILLLNIYLARELDPFLYGDLAIAIQFISITSILLCLGSNTTASRFLPTLHGRENHLKYLNWNRQLVTKPIILSSIGAIIIILSVCALRGAGHYGQHDIHLAFYFSAIVPIAIPLTLLTSFFFAEKSPEKALLSQYFYSNFVSLIFLLGFSALIGVLHEPFILLLTFFIGYSLALMISRALYKRIHHRIDVLKLDNAHPEKQDEQSWKKTSLKMFASNLCAILYAPIDLFLLEIIAIEKNEHYVGYYAASMSVVLILLMLRWCCFESTKREISKLHEDGETGEIKTLFKKTLQKSLAFALPICTLICVFRHEILSLFSPVYIIAGTTLFVLALKEFFQYFSTGTYTVLLYTGNEKTALSLQITRIITFLAIGIPMVLHFGILGAALSKLSITFLFFLLSTMKIRKKIGVKLLGFM